MSTDPVTQSLLVIEDDPSLGEVLRTQLELEGFDVRVAANGEDALALLRDGFRPSVIFLDLMMPRMSGLEFRAQQRTDPELSAIPVVVWSGGRAVREVAAEMDAAGYLTKPTDWDVFIEMAQKFRGSTPHGS